MSKAADIYEKVIDGDFVTDVDLIFGIEFYDNLFNQLHQCGPVFKLSANEALRIYRTLHRFQEERTSKR